MTGWLFQVLALVAAVNPAAAALAATAGGAVRTRQAVVAAAVAAALLTGAVLAADPALDALDISPESFRTAAGIVMATQGARMVWDPRSWYRPGASMVAGAVPLGWPVLANAAALMVTVSFAADTGDARVIGASAVAVGLGGAAIALARGAHPAASGTARLLGAVLVAAAAALVVSGVRDV